MSTVAAAQSGPSRTDGASGLNTIPDPRAPTPVSAGSRTPSTEQNPHPELNNEVATLSTKLINAINHQTNLDDSLQETREELGNARERIKQLEGLVREHNEALEHGVLVNSRESAQVEENLRKSITEERRKRYSAEKEKKSMEQELENLTSQLFEEANGMVASARKGREAAERRTDRLRSQLKDSESLLASQQEQLKDLKNVLEQVQPGSPHANQSATAPATPVTGPNERASSESFAVPLHTRNQLSIQSLPPPESPLHFSNLIFPVVRTDVQAYEDFIALLRTSKGGGPPSRTSSGNYSGLNVLGLGSKDFSSTQSTVIPGSSVSSGPLNASSRSTSAQNTPNPGASHTPSASGDISYSASDPTTLKDNKFYKRALVEDIEPTLRLDTAPGLSWLARRTVLSSINTGKLVIEPFPPRTAFHSPTYACALCGEARTSEEHLRRYRFKTSDNDDAQRYPLCDYCLSRVRAVCDFTGFLRTARRGQWRNENEQDCRAAWEECVRLREKLFWARLGGGVVPVGGSATHSPVPSGTYNSFKPSIDKSKSEADLQAMAANTALREKPDFEGNTDGPVSATTDPEASPGIDSPPAVTSTVQEAKLDTTTVGTEPPSATFRSYSLQYKEAETDSTSGQAVKTESDIPSPRSSRPASPNKLSGSACASPAPRLQSHPSFEAQPTAGGRSSMPPGMPPSSIRRSPSPSRGRTTSSPAPRKNNIVAALASKFQDAAAISSEPISRPGSRRRSSDRRPSSHDAPAPMKLPGSFN
ncbi:MAG: rab guanine nucleotide exchange factor S2 [Alyxoria varia]|nr:MAG: rab guanine nucleotide exchange factor S2 [Alyxoria varia]